MRPTCRCLIATLLLASGWNSYALETRPPQSALDVTVAEGALRGTLTAGGARAWYAIPYAAPPVGARRWQAPSPARHWQGVREAKKFGAPCTQPSVAPDGQATIVGSEDCLTLNVFHPPGAIDRELPVMVWVHGGGQIYGTGASYDGTRLAMTENVIVVTINYRLGPFGWFHHPAITGTGSKRVTGQFALEDVLAALQWVRLNIAAFGGDAGNVTLFGESAGAQNVYALLFAPQSRGLFHRAIAESGGFWNMHLPQAVNAHDESVPGSPLSAREVVAQWLVRSDRAADRATALGLERRLPPKALARWLRTLTPAEVLAPYIGAAHLEYDFPSVVYDGRLLPTLDHRALLAQRRYQAVPLLLGGNRDEEKAYLWSDPAFVEGVGAELRIRDPAHYEAVNRLYSDWWNFAAVDDLLPRLSSPVYAYRFDWNDEPVAPVNFKALYGSAHGLELPFVFGDFSNSFFHAELPEELSGVLVTSPLDGLFTADNANSRERTSAAMMAYWGEFARTGRPGHGNRSDYPEWPAWSQAKSKLVFGNGTLAFDATLVEESDLKERVWSTPGLTLAERCAIYLDNTMYPRYPTAELKRRGCRY